MTRPVELAGALLPVALLAVVGLVVWSRIRPGAGGGSAALELGATVGQAIAGAASDVAGGIVQGVGQAVGIPRTNEAECAAALREGRMWDASFACPAADFLTGAWRTVADGAPGAAPPAREGGATGSW
jgi:hypothetical protein